MSELELFEQQERIKLKLKKEFRDKEIKEWSEVILFFILIFLWFAFLGWINS